MSLSDDLGAVRRAQSRKCELAKWLETRTPEEVAMVRRAIADKGKPTRRIAEVLTEHGYPVSAGTINGHRNGECVTCRSLMT